MCLLVGAIALPTSEHVRKIFYKVAVTTLSGVEEVINAGDTAEVRMVDSDNFDKTIRTPGRLVVVDFRHESTYYNDGDTRLASALERLPSKVLIAKVLAERNVELMDRLQIHNIPTVRVYREGQLLEEFKGGVDQKQLITVVKYHIAHPDSRPHRAGYIGPLERDWLPEGVQPQSFDAEVTPLNFNK